MHILNALGIRIRVTIIGAFDTQLADAIDRYEHTITATCGFESMRCSFVAREDRALHWLERLGAACVVSGPDAEVVWEGMLTGVQIQFGQESVSLSLDGMANRVKVRYTDELGTPGSTATASDAASQGRYGTRDLVLSIGETNATTAANLRDRALAQYKNPVAQTEGSVQTGDLGDVRVSLSFAGYYTTLDWLLTANTSTTSTSTTTQVQTLLTAYAAINGFVSTNYGNISSSGVSDTEYIAPDTTYRQKIEHLLQQGNSNNDRLAWGVYEDRRMAVTVWAGASPTVIHYIRHLGEAHVRDAQGGGIVAPYTVRPDRNYRVVNAIDEQPIGTVDTLATRYIERVTCSASGTSMGVTIEPQASTGLDALLARMNAT